MSMNDDIAREMHERYPNPDNRPLAYIPHPWQRLYTREEVRDFVKDVLGKIERAVKREEERSYKRHVDRTEGRSY